MGYYVTINEHNVFMSKDTFADAYKALCDLNRHDHLKRGGSNTGAVWYSWMPENYESETETVLDILDLLGLTVEGDDDGNIVGFQYDNKMGAEEVFLAALAPYIKDGSFINWAGDDGAMWQHRFENGRMTRHDAIVTYGEAYEPVVSQYAWEGDQMNVTHHNINDTIFGKKEG